MIHCPENYTIQVADSKRSATEIQLAIHLERQLKNIMQLTVRAHVCEYDLQLFGLVDSWHEKQQVQEFARALAPEYRICNELRVRRSQALTSSAR